MKYSVTFRTIVYPTLCKISLSAVRITIYITRAYRESISYIPIGRLRNPLRSVLMIIHIKWRRRWWRWPVTMMANNDYFSTRIRELIIGNSLVCEPFDGSLDLSALTLKSIDRSPLLSCKLSSSSRFIHWLL